MQIDRAARGVDEDGTVKVGRLSSREHWSGRWDKTTIRDLRFDPTRRNFVDLHRLFRRHIPTGPEFRFLEVGAYPGSYLWYFNKYFGMQVSGLEYVAECCDKAREYLNAAGLAASIIHADFFEYEVEREEEAYDLVASFGFVEHFSDIRGVLSRKLGLVRPGGWMAVVVPNHTGIYGGVLKAVNREKYLTHNRMSLADLLGALQEIGDAEVVEAGYFGHFGFWNSGLYSAARGKGSIVYSMVRPPAWCLEALTSRLPDSKTLSPYIAAVVRKPR